MHRVTIKDIAREAGVSAQTVSRAINDRSEIQAETKARILDIAGRMGYHPNSVARSLVSRHTQNIGLVVPDVMNPFFSEIARGIQDAAFESGYNVFLCNADESLERAISVLHSLEAQRVDGLILCSSRLTDREMMNLAERYQPLVLINRQISHARTRQILVDDHGGAYRAVEHLIGLGHREIGILTGPANSHSGRERLQGYERALMAHGLTPTARWQVPCAPKSEGGRTAAKELLSRSPELTALLCYNDLAAIGVYQAAAELGLDVPQSLSIVGYDDIPFASLVSPTLTTVHIPKYELGVRAMNLILDALEHNEPVAGPVTLDTQLIVRGSTGSRRGEENEQHRQSGSGF